VALSKEWDRRETEETKRTLLATMLSDPVGLLFLIALSPLFLAV